MGWQTFVEWLRRPILGTAVVPPDARVDPAAFPEEDFPVYCPRCEYLLRGLPDGRCPECGLEFERGRLLVTEYALECEESCWRRNRASRVLMWLAIGGLIVVLVGPTGSYVLAHWLQRRAAGAAVRAPGVAPTAWSRIETFLMLVRAGQVLVLGLLVASLWVGSRHYYRFSDKRRRVLDAIRASRPGRPPAPPAEPCVKKTGETRP